MPWPAAHLALGATLFHLGEPAAARAHLEQGLRAYDRHQQEALILQFGEDRGVICLSYAAWALQLIGHPDQALARSREALALAEALSHPLTLAHELAYSGFFYQFRREGRTAQARAEATIDLVAEHGFSPLWGAHGTLVRGWALAEHGQADEALTVLAEALVTARRTGERSHEAELHRLQGELTPHQSGSGIPGRQAEPEAEACFLEAIETAREQGAKLFELRAVMSLGRLRMRQGRQAEARSALAELYGWFTEGFDTKDLWEARALLGKLG
jgi:tetratricopeptide (TPR) repeat protein